VFHIAIISSSVRIGRASHRLALYFKKYLTDHNLATVELLDLKAYHFPLFDERLAYHPNPTESMLDFSSRIQHADGVIIVTPENNGGYPASLKNVVDLLYDEWYKKPIAIAAASDGDFGGTQVITSLQFSLWKIRAFIVPARFHVQRVQDAFNENGMPAETEKMDKRTKGFLDELFWCMEAKKRMQDYKSSSYEKK
jgi:NAD(P)H-dependent FMN reductase